MFLNGTFRPLFRLFSSFQRNVTILSIQFTVLGFELRTSEHDSSPITTRSGLPPLAENVPSEKTFNFLGIYIASKNVCYIIDYWLGRRPNYLMKIFFLNKCTSEVGSCWFYTN